MTDHSETSRRQHAAEHVAGHPEAIRFGSAHIPTYGNISTEQAVRMWAIEYVLGRVAFGKGSNDELFVYTEKIVTYVMKGSVT